MNGLLSITTLLLIGSVQSAAVEGGGGAAGVPHAHSPVTVDRAAAILQNDKIKETDREDLQKWFEKQHKSAAISAKNVQIAGIQRIIKLLKNRGAEKADIKEAEELLKKLQTELEEIKNASGQSRNMPSLLMVVIGAALFFVN